MALLDPTFFHFFAVPKRGLSTPSLCGKMFLTMKKTDKQEIIEAISELTEAIARSFDEQNKKFTSDISGVNGKLDTFRDELKAEISTVRSELKTEISGVRSELKADISGIRGDLSDIHNSVKDVEIRLAKVDF